MERPVLRAVQQLRSHFDVLLVWTQLLPLQDITYFFSSG